MGRTETLFETLAAADGLQRGHRLPWLSNRGHLALEEMGAPEALIKCLRDIYIQLAATRNHSQPNGAAAIPRQTSCSTAAKSLKSMKSSTSPQIASPPCACIPGTSSSDSASPSTSHFARRGGQRQIATEPPSQPRTSHTQVADERSAHTSTPFVTSPPPPWAAHP